jgi:hypothetical protein
MAPSISESFSKAFAYLVSDEAARFAVTGITLRTELGLVEFTLDAAGRIAGRQVQA